jgi:hypothetical protein
VFAASVWITSDSFDSAPRITAATMQATCWSGEAVIVRSGARRILPSRILTSAISAANQILGEPDGEPSEADTGRHRATSGDDQSGKLALEATPGDVFGEVMQDHQRIGMVFRRLCGHGLSLRPPAVLSLPAAPASIHMARTVSFGSP